jgi:hypothetical protein
LDKMATVKWTSTEPSSPNGGHIHSERTQPVWPLYPLCKVPPTGSPGCWQYSILCYTATVRSWAKKNVHLLRPVKDTLGLKVPCILHPMWMWQVFYTWGRWDRSLS